MSEFTCTCCKHRAAIFKYFPESGELVCRLCQDLGKGLPARTLRALGFLFRINRDNWPKNRLKTLTAALIKHDRALRGEA